MMLIMDDTQITTLDQIREVLAGSRAITFKATHQRERYAWIEAVLKRFGYFKLSKSDKGAVKAYLRRMSGFSRAQLTRLVTACLLDGAIRPKAARRHRFASKYTAFDKELLAETDNAHGRLSGPATSEILRRQYEVYDDKRFVRLKDVSVAHIYRLRGSRAYQKLAQTFSKTRGVSIAIGVRRKPNPRGRPGYIRVDTVHQGDQGGKKGVYHINLVDEVTQWEIVICVEAISEAHLQPALQAALEMFPFVIVNFHSDNGGEFINGTVAKLLNKLLVEQTKSRANRTNDNALVEGKNGSVIRKHIGYSHIDRKYAPIIDVFYRDYFNPYLNFHRPCAFATVTVDEKGRRHKKYETYQTPFERLKSIPKATRFLREGDSLAALEEVAGSHSDNESAAAMQAAKDRLFKRLGGHSILAACRDIRARNGNGSTATMSNGNDCPTASPTRTRLPASSSQRRTTRPGKRNRPKSNDKEETQERNTTSTSFRLISG